MDGGRGWNGACGPVQVPPRPTPPPNPNLDAPPFVDGWPLPASTLNKLFSYLGFSRGLAPGPYLPILGGRILGNLSVDGCLVIGNPAGGCQGPGTINATDFFLNGQKFTGEGIGIVIAARPPTNPFNGQPWWDSNSGQLYIWYNDGTSSQWVVASPNVGGGGGTIVQGPDWVATGVAPPAAPFDNQLWWDTTDGNLYIFYNDGSSRQWVIANNLVGDPPAGGIPEPPTTGQVFGRIAGSWVSVVPTAGGTMQGPLILSGPPTTLSPANQAATKDYVLARTGGSMLGPLILSGPPTAASLPNTAVTKGYVDALIGSGGGGGISSIIAGAGLTGGVIMTSGQTIALAVPVSIANGGTGATSAPAALTALGGVTQSYVDTAVAGAAGQTWVTAGATPPANPFDNQLWWDANGGALYIRYFDGNSRQWVAASPGGGGGGGGTGTITGVTAGAGLQGGGTSGSVTLSLANNPNLPGTPTAATAPAGTNNTQLATTAFVTAAIAASPGGGGGVVNQINVTAPITGGGSAATVNIGLATSPAVGSYTNANITVDTYGRVTAASSGAAGPGGYLALTGGALTGPLLINTTGVTPQSPAGPAQVLQLASAGATAIAIDSAGPTAVPRMTIRRAYGALNNLQAIPTSTQLGFIEFRGWDGTDWNGGANIQCTSTAAWGSGSSPTRMDFQTTPVGSTVPVPRMYIGALGGLVVGSPPPGDRGAGTINAQAIYSAGDLNVGGTIYILGTAITIGPNNSAGAGFRTITIANA